MSWRLTISTSFSTTWRGCPIPPSSRVDPSRSTGRDQFSTQEGDNWTRPVVRGGEVVGGGLTGGDVGRRVAPSGAKGREPGAPREHRGSTPSWHVSSAGTSTRSTPRVG